MSVLFCVSEFYLFSFPHQVLDGLLAQYGTVENVEQGTEFFSSLFAVHVIFIWFQLFNSHETV